MSIILLELCASISGCVLSVCGLARLRKLQRMSKIEFWWAIAALCGGFVVSVVCGFLFAQHFA